MPKKKLTKQLKVYYNGSKPIKHECCGHTVAFLYEGKFFVRCKKCREWVGIELNN